MPLTDKCGISSCGLADFPEDIPINCKSADDIAKKGAFSFSAEVERPNRAGVKVPSAY